MKQSITGRIQQLVPAQRARRGSRAFAFATVLTVGAISAPVTAQGAWPTRFSEIPGHDRWQEVSRQQARLVTGGRVSQIRWLDDENAVEFRRADGRWLMRLDDLEIVAAPEREVEAPAARPPRGGQGFRRPARGRQADLERSPDGRWDAICRDHNVVLRATDGSVERVITTDGDARFGFGRASWVYGEELGQNTAMWWSPDSSMLAFYEFDDRPVTDVAVATDLVDVRPTIVNEPYPKAGEPNPIAKLLIVHLETDEIVRVDVGDSTDQYVYRVEFSPDGAALLFHRMNRRQDTLELVAADPRTGAANVALVERQETWQNPRPTMTFLEDGRRFIWRSERTGVAQYELWALDGSAGASMITELTAGPHPVGEIVRIDEEMNVMWHVAFSAEHPLSAQLHRVALDGSGSTRLTREDGHHSGFDISPDGRHFVCTVEAVDLPPATGIHDADGNRIAWLAQSDASAMQELGVPMPEPFTFLAADGETRLHGVLYKPTNFDPNRAWPLLIDVYGGPGVRTVRNTFSPARPDTELGFLIALLENRGIPGRTKAFESATYLRLGVVDLDDQAAGVRALVERPYIDGGRVGITGSSYGGYMSALALLRHPDLFHVAVAVAAVTDWRQYDTIYTERYMRTPQENAEGYDLGSCVLLADKLQGNLLIMHGMVDDNVHATNAWALIDALQRLDRPFEMVFFPRAGHGVGGPAARSAKWTFLWRHLVGGE